VRRFAVMFVWAVTAAVAAGCGDNSAAPDAGRILVAQVCGADTCTPLEACMTEWTVTCELLNNPPAACIPCAPDAGVYHCPLVACGTLPPGCKSCDCLMLDPDCECYDNGASIAVACHQPR